MRTTRFILSLIVLILTILVTNSKAEVTTNVTTDVDVQTNVTTQPDNPGTGDVTTITETITTTTTTTDTITTTTTTVAGKTENLTSSEHHTVDICNDTDVSCTGLIQNRDGLGKYNSWGVEMGYSGGTVTINKDLNDYFTTDELNAGFTGSLSADILFNCGNQIGGDCSSGRQDRIILRQTYTDNNGNYVHQSRTIDDYNTGWQNLSLDNVTVNSNNASSWTGKAEIYGQDLGYWGPLNGDYFGPHVDNIDWEVTNVGGTTTSSSTVTDIDVDVTTTYETTVQYCFELGTCPSDNTTARDLANATVADDGKTYDEFIDERLKDIKIEDLTLVDTTIIVEDLDGKFEEFKIEDYAIETFESFIETNDLTETFETALIEEDLGREEFFDTMTDSIKEEFGEEFDMGGDDFKTEDLTTEGGPSDLTTESETEELKTETETSQIEDANADTNTTKETEEVSNETSEESTSTETVSNESSMDKDSQTERSETETNTNETVETEQIGDVKTENVAVDSIEKKVERVIAKVIAKLKDVDKKLQAVQYLTTQGITAGQADISGYINKRVYLNQKQIPEISFYSNVNILEQQQIYNNVSLEQYTSNDLIGKKQKQLFDVQEDINRIKAEIYALKQKRG